MSIVDDTKNDLDLCRRFRERILFLLGGLAGLGLFATGDVAAVEYGQAPSVLAPISVTTSFLSAFFLARAYWNGEVKYEALRKAVRTNAADLSGVTLETIKREYEIGMWLLASAAIVFMIAVWW